MPTITKLEPSKHIPGRYLVFFGNDLLKVTDNEVLSFSLYVGREVSGDELPQLRASGQFSSAKAAAARMMSAKAMSRGTLIEKLIAKGEDPAAAEAAADRLEELGVVNDAAYAAMVVRHYAGRGYGAKRMEQELYRRKVPRELWAQALTEAEDAASAVDRLIQQRLRGREPDEKTLGRLQNFLLRRGFSWQEVRDGLERYHQGETVW